MPILNAFEDDMKKDFEEIEKWTDKKDNFHYTWLDLLLNNGEYGIFSKCIETLNSILI
jgi:hypothetical protein